MEFIYIVRGILGIAILLAICFLLSADKKHIKWDLVGIGIGLQLVLAILLFKVPFVRHIFQYVVDFFIVVIQASTDAATFLVGDLAKPGGPFGFAFAVLPTIIFFSAISSILYYLGILQRIVWVFAWLMKKTMKLSGAESLAAAANVFIGQTEAPLVIKPYLEKMTKSEILTLMTGGMATIAGSVFGAYIAMLGGGDAEQQSIFGMHLLTASIISAPAAIVAAKMLFPETEENLVNKDINIPRSEAGSNFLDALARGTTDGMKLAVNVAIMLLSFMAFIYLLNGILGSLGDMLNINAWIKDISNGQFESLSMQAILGALFAPMAWVIGIPQADILLVGQLLGEKTILNEFVSYASLEGFILDGKLSERAIIISTYALCGFANFASIGIQIGGIGSLAPGQRKTLTQFGVKSLIGGTIACLLTACIAGILI